MLTPRDTLSASEASGGSSQTLGNLSAETQPALVVVTWLDQNVSSSFLIGAALEACRSSSSTNSIWVKHPASTQTSAIGSNCKEKSPWSWGLKESSKEDWGLKCSSNLRSHNHTNHYLSFWSARSRRHSHHIWVRALVLSHRRQSLQGGPGHLSSCPGRQHGHGRTHPLILNNHLFAYETHH